MAHVRLVTRKSGTAWECRWRDNGIFKQRSFATEKEAIDFSHEVRLEKRDTGTSGHLARRSKTFREVAEASMEASATRLKPKSQGGYELGYRVHIYPTFGHRQINSITSLEIEKWLRQMETKVSTHTGRPLAPASILGCFIGLSKVFSYAMKHRIIVANPCAVVDKPRLRKVEPVFLHPSDVAAVSEALDAHAPYGLIVRFAAYTGLRAGELAALRIGDVAVPRIRAVTDPRRGVGDLRGHVQVRRTVQRTKAGWVVGEPKSVRSTRDVPLDPDLQDELAAYLANHPRRNDPTAGLWPGRLPGNHGTNTDTLDWDRQFDPVTLYRYYFKPTLARLGLPDVRWHDLRHFYASACADARIEIHKVSRWMGHANVSTTDSIYTHLFNGDHSSDMRKLGSVRTGTATSAVRQLRN